MPHSCGRPHAPRLHRHYYQEERTPAVRRPSHEEIARMAYSYWEARGRKGGSPEEDWHRAARAMNAYNPDATWSKAVTK